LAKQVVKSGVLTNFIDHLQQTDRK